MKVIKLDRQDLRQLVGLVLEDQIPQPTDQKRGTPGDELSNTKDEMLQQARENINSMLDSKNVGLIVSLFIILLTDKASEQQMRMLGKSLEDHLANGGKELDFSSTITRVIKPYTKTFVKALINILGSETEDTLLKEVETKDTSSSRIAEAHADLKLYTHQLDRLNKFIEKNPDSKNNPKVVKALHFINQQIADIKETLSSLGEGLDTNKAKLKKTALTRIQNMSSNPDVLRIFSMMLLYLTDPDTKSDLEQLGTTYGTKLRDLVNNNPTTWTEDLVAKLRSKFIPIVSNLADAVSKQLPQQKEEQGKQPTGTETFQQDKNKISQIMGKYNIK